MAPMRRKPAAAAAAATAWQRALLRRARTLSPRSQACAALCIGLVAGLVCGYVLAGSTRDAHPAAAAAVLPATASKAYVAPGDRCFTHGAHCYAFVFATGRSGTQHLARALVSARGTQTRAYVTHEREHARLRTKTVVEREYRRMAAARDEAEFHRVAREYVRRVKVPFYREMMRLLGASRLVYTGHVPMVWGMGGALVEALPGEVRVVRVRRERMATAVSLMALGPEEEDPWGATSVEEEGGGQVASVERRWFPKPGDAFVRLEVEAGVWGRWNRFQRWLWYVDDVECRWQGLKRGYEGRFSWMEEGLADLQVLDGGGGWRRVAQFMGVEVDWAKARDRDNSIEGKKRVKVNVSETTLREWDVAYRREVGVCRLDDGSSYGWEKSSRQGG